MDFKKTQKEYTENKIPTAWENVVMTEKKAELLIYDILVQCMQSFEDISLELSNEEPIVAVLKNWARNENIKFGTNAITLKSTDNETLIINCQYDMWKLSEDLEMIANDLFGSLNLDKVGESIIEGNVDIPDDEVDELLNGIQKKKVPFINKELK